MSPTDKIVILNSDHSIIAVLEKKNGSLFKTIKNSSIQIKLDDALTDIQQRGASMQFETQDEIGVLSLSIKKVAFDDDRYLRAVVEELSHRNFRAFLVSGPLLKILEIVTKKLPKNVLDEELGNFLAMSPEAAQSAYEILQEVSSETGTSLE